MPNLYIESLQMNEFDGKFTEELSFANGLNIISGENGTGKTKTLISLKSERARLAANPEGKENANQLRVFALSPKRNAERRAYEDAYAQIKRENKTYPQYLSRVQSKAIQDNSFENYDSFVDLFGYYYEDKIAAGNKTPIEVTQEIEDEFNTVLQRLFTDYAIVARWNPTLGNTKIFIKKSGTELDVNKLSLGEQEIFSLIFNIFVSREGQDVYLIDEPEIHLNWSLEDKLFMFFDWFCQQYEKQMIVVTHSRIIFKDEFYPKTQFLVWEDRKVIAKKEISAKQRAAIAGEAISLIRMAAITKKTFFVEDRAHEAVLRKLMQRIDPALDIDIVPMGKKDAVVGMYKTARANPGEWDQAFFLIDGDNQGNPFPGDAHFIQLSQYCIENYLLDVPTMTQVLGKTEDEIKAAILEAIQFKKADILKHYKFLDFVIDRLTVADITQDLLAKFDCSEIIERVLAHFGTSLTPYIDAYIPAAPLTIFDAAVISQIN